MPSTSTMRDARQMQSTSVDLDLTQYHSFHSENLEISLDLTMADDPTDPDYIPDIAVINPLATDDLDETCAHDELYDCVTDVDIEDEEEEQETGGLDRVSVENIPMRSVIACEEQLAKLAKLNPIQVCDRKGCNGAVTIEVTTRGSALQMKWLCTNKHIVRRWMSQPVTTKGSPVVNLQLAAAILFSGNNRAKVAQMLKIAGIQFTGPTSFFKLQGHILFPTIEEMWMSMKTEKLQQLEGKSVIIAGDGRMDSPGFCAKYCTYTVMDYETKEILECIVIDKRQVDLKSTNMEMLAFKKALATFEQFGVTVKEVVTDAHMGIGAFMRKNRQNIKHSYDIWHGAKNLGKKIATASLQKGSTELKPWTSHITNHFWYSSKTCAGSTQALMLKLRSALHHSANVHSWAFGECDHEPLDADQTHIAWLEGGSQAHRKLTEILSNKRFTNTLEHYTNFRSTGELESFQNHILAYAAKRFAYSFNGYRARCYLAAIDYNKHLHRSLKTNTSGEVMYHRQYSKKAAHWTAIPVKVPKEFSYMGELVKTVVAKSEYVTMRAPTEMSEDDPRRIAETIAPIPPPPTSEIIAEREKFSRFKD